MTDRAHQNSSIRLKTAMSRIARPHSAQANIRAERGDGTNAVDHNTDSTWPEPAIPDDPREQRKIRTS